jgi:hypothetical protein
MRSADSIGMSIFSPAAELLQQFFGDFLLHLPGAIGYRKVRFLVAGLGNKFTAHVFFPTGESK